MPELIQSLQEESLTDGLVAAATVDRRRKRLRRRTGHLLARSCHWHCCSNESGVWGGSSKICCHTWLFSSLAQITAWQINRENNKRWSWRWTKVFVAFLDFSGHFCSNLWKLAHAKMRMVQKVESGCVWRLGLLLFMKLLLLFGRASVWLLLVFICVVIERQQKYHYQAPSAARKKQQKDRKDHSVSQKRRAYLLVLLWWSRLELHYYCSSEGFR